MGISSSEQPLIAAARRKFERIFKWQVGLTAVWMVYAVVVEHSQNVLRLGLVMVLAAATLVVGSEVPKASKDRLSLLYQIYGLLCTVVCFAIFLVVGAPSIRHVTEQGLDHVSDRALAGTLLSTAYVCVSVRATTLAQAYGEAVAPLKPTKGD
mmetsp:Transcript_21640/g.69688  ORF Transcript_21640/g.69688 Transcript_21640/m.69688 type:complete len:153 (-) Transcript_21640:1501-1959(-)